MKKSVLSWVIFFVVLATLNPSTSNAGGGSVVVRFQDGKLETSPPFVCVQCEQVVTPHTCGRIDFTGKQSDLICKRINGTCQFDLKTQFEGASCDQFVVSYEPADSEGRCASERNGEQGLKCTEDSSGICETTRVDLVDAVSRGLTITAKDECTSRCGGKCISSITGTLLYNKEPLILPQGQLGGGFKSITIESSVTCLDQKRTCTVKFNN